MYKFHEQETYDIYSTHSVKKDGEKNEFISLAVQGLCDLNDAN